MNKRVLSCVLVIICILAFFVNTAAAVYPIVGYDIDYWYSNGGEIGMWSDKSIDVYVGTNSESSSLSIANLKSYLSTAQTSWSCTGISINYVNQQSSADLAFGAITRNQATSIGVPTNVVGATYPSGTKLATLYYHSSEKALYGIESATVYLIESDPTATTTGARKISVHEMGHALGYFGHYNSGTVMTTWYGDITSLTPSTAEKNHLKQVY